MSSFRDTQALPSPTHTCRGGFRSVSTPPPKPAHLQSAPDDPRRSEGSEPYPQYVPALAARCPAASWGVSKVRSRETDLKVIRPMCENTFQCLSANRVPAPLTAPHDALSSSQ